MAKSKNSDGEMTFLEHLEEMRGVILRSLLVFSIALVGVGTGFGYFNSIMLYPLNTAKKLIETYPFFQYISGADKKMDEAAKNDPKKIGPVYIVPEGGGGKTGPFYIVSKDGNTAVLKTSSPKDWAADIKLRSMSFATPIVVWFYVSFLGALCISLPFIAYFVAQFVLPGLTQEEKKLLKPGMAAAAILFCIGAAFAFMFMLPMGIAFMSSMSESMQMEMFPDAQSYYSMVLFLTLAVGVIFEVPLVEVVLIYLGVLKTEWLRKNRRMAFLVLLIFATVITPPDFITQISLTVPLYMLYEIALRVGERLRARKLRREAELEKLEAEEDERDRREYAKMVAKERLAEEKKEEESGIEIDKTRYGESEIPDDYDPNKIDEDDNYYGYGEEDFDEDEYGLEPYIDYGRLAKTAPDFSPNWDLNRPDTDFMTPDWSQNEPPASENPQAENNDAPAAEPAEKSDDI
ncbi:MAG: preprotein translocase subunit TatC [Opitutales bacterium]|nr:preprotein translocase subunit TatC [Opitutales bacterium]